ncbi:MAG TPA: hypothetical protein VHG08_08720 [Longimicrobium sp.]|nr:hypothetical protein [Longimicrobium sp.]
MKGTIRLAGTLALAAALGTAAPAAAQRHQSHVVHNNETHIISNHGGGRLEIRSRGQVEFNDEGDWVVSVPADGLFTVEESGSGPDRRVEFRPGQDGPRVRFFVNGGERPLDASGREWARRLIRRAVRENGVGAERRVARIRARSGVSGVLAEIAELETDLGRRSYYRALLNGGRLSTAEFTRVMDDVGRRMGSDTETRLVLVDAAAQAGDGTRMASLLRAAGTMESDVETRLVLNHLADRQQLADAAARAAFFRVAEGMSSDVERRLVLNAVADERPAEGSSREAFFRAVNRMSSDVERRLVLSRVLDGASVDATVGALQSAAAMSSDTEKRLVLMQVPAAHLRNARVTAAYRRVVDAMRSDTERSLALRRLADGHR